MVASHRGYKRTLLTPRINAKDREKKLLRSWTAARVEKKKKKENRIAARENCEVEKENRVHTLEQSACQHHNQKWPLAHTLSLIRKKKKKNLRECSMLPLEEKGMPYLATRRGSQVVRLTSCSPPPLFFLRTSIIAARVTRRVENGSPILFSRQILTYSTRRFE